MCFVRLRRFKCNGSSGRNYATCAKVQNYTAQSCIGGELLSTWFNLTDKKSKSKNKDEIFATMPIDNNVNKYRLIHNKLMVYFQQFKLLVFLSIEEAGSFKLPK